MSILTEERNKIELETYTALDKYGIDPTPYNIMKIANKMLENIHVSLEWSYYDAEHAVLDCFRIIKYNKLSKKNGL